MYLREVGHEGVHWIDLRYNRFLMNIWLRIGLFGFHKKPGIRDQVSNYWLLKEESAAWNYVAVNS
jgi:hypothetical protein